MDFKELISVAGYGIETIGVLVIIVGSAVSSFRFLSHFRKEAEDLHMEYSGDNWGVQ